LHNGYKWAERKKITEKNWMICCSFSLNLSSFWLQSLDFHGKPFTTKSSLSKPLGKFKPVVKVFRLSGYQNCVRQPCSPFKMATITKIEISVLSQYSFIFVQYNLHQLCKYDLFSEKNWMICCSCSFNLSSLWLTVNQYFW
jgi:hypothetical protein